MKMETLLGVVIILFVFSIYVADNVITNLKTQLKSKTEEVERFKNVGSSALQGEVDCENKLKACGCE